MPDWVRILIEVVAVLGGGATVSYVLTLRQRKALLAAQASDTLATGQARILDAAGRIVENSADLVPQLVGRIARLEAASEARQAQLANMGAELDEVHRFVDEASRWMQNAVRLIAELGGHISPPPAAPVRRPFPRPQPPLDPSVDALGAPAPIPGGTS